MIVAQVIQLTLGKIETLVSQTSISTLIFRPQTEEQGSATDTRHDVERESDTKTLRIPRRMTGDEDVLGNECGGIAASDLERSADDPSVACSEIIQIPHDEDGHEDVDAGGDGEHAEIADTDRICLRQFNRPSDHADGGSQHAECVSVLEPVAEPGDGDG